MPAETAVAIAAAVRSGEIEAVAVAERALAAAEESQAQLNAFTHIDRDRALRQAAVVDAVVASGADPGPLAGVPVGLKDLIDERGVANTAGAAFAATVPDRDAPVVARLRDAGAVIVGRTGLHEFAFGFTSENAHFGPVRNPWDPALSVGGSSGGSGAAVSAGIAPIAVGTDTGGSVRVPAALCGVMGLKVTWGRVPLDGVIPLAPTLDTVGPLARTVADLEAAYRVMAGDTTRPGAPKRSIAVVRQWNPSPLSDDVAAGFDGALRAMEDAGIEIVAVDEAALEVPPAVVEASLAEIAAIHRTRWQADPGRYGPDVAARLRSANDADPGAVTAAEAWAGAANAVLAGVFSQCDAVALPTVGAVRKVIGVDEITVAGVAHQHRVLLASWTFPINRLRLPALALPLPAAAGPPPSLQLVGPHHGEAGLLAFARLLEADGVIAVARPPIWCGA